MDEYLITKKELLNLTGISYGSLYRWKRKNLIPDEWFIHRATFTGHETFFPKDKILARIDKIQKMKEGMSLDDIAETFNPSPGNILLDMEEIERIGIAPRSVIDLYLFRYGSAERYDFERLFPLYLCSELLRLGTLNRDETFLAIDLWKKYEAKRPDCKLLFLRKLGVCSCCLLPGSGPAYFDDDTAIISEISIEQLQTSLKELLKEGGKYEQG